jgi:glyoxylase-like metal-dependent hydrolase (beta-lactamase superfamily II)
VIGKNVFTGDALFMPDYGTGRCDFPKGSATDLFASVMRLYQLPDETQVFVGHDYQPNGRPVLFMSTVGESKKSNIQLKVSTNEDEFITFRQNRDKTLKAPKLLLPSIQVNIDGGRIPHQESNGKSYLKIPVNMDLSNLKV